MNIYNIITVKSTLIVSLLIFNSACTSTDPKRVEEDFGKSVRQMVQAQIYDTHVAHQPALLAPDLLDGEAVVDSVDGYRKASKSARNQEITPSNATVTQ